MTEKRMHGCRQSDETSVLARASCSPDENLSKRVVAALEAATGYDAVAGGETLYDAVDPDALDALFASTSSSERGVGCVKFPVDGVEVIVSADGEITVTGRRDA